MSALAAPFVTLGVLVVPVLVVERVWAALGWNKEQN